MSWSKQLDTVCYLEVFEKVETATILSLFMPLKERFPLVYKVRRLFSERPVVVSDGKLRPFWD